MSTPLEELTAKSGPASAPRTAPAPGAGGEPSITPEDAGSQALADALRSSFAIVKVIMVLLVVVFFASGVFTVPSQERAIVMRFGRPVGATPEEQLLGSGLHWSFPYPIDEIVRIPISQIQAVTSTTGWYAVAPGEEDDINADAVTGSLNPAVDGYTLTGDGNIMHVKVVLRYTINNPLNYTLNFVNASHVLQNALDNALIYASAQFTVDQALKSAALDFKEKIVARVRQLVDEQGLGLTIGNADVTSIPPKQVRQAFKDVVNADLKRRQQLEDARGYANSNITVASSQARVIINNAETDRARLVQSLAAEAEYFTNQLPYYRGNPSLFLARLQTETIGRTLTNAEYKILRTDPAKSMRIQAAREQEKPTPPPPR